MTDPTPASILVDILFAASLAQLVIQFKGGLTLNENPTFFTDGTDVETEALRRLDSRVK